MSYIAYKKQLLKITITFIITLSFSISSIHSTKTKTSGDITDFLLKKGTEFTTKINKKLNMAYYTPWNTKGEKLAEKYAKKIDILSPVWFDLKPEIVQTKYNTNIDGSNYIDKSFLQKLKKINPKMKIIPRFQCSGFSGETYSLMLNEKHSQALIKNIVKRVKFSKFDGVTLECTQLWFSEELYSLYAKFQQNLFTELKKVKKELIITMFPYSEVTGNVISKVRFEYLSRYTNYIVIMTYDYPQYIKTENMNKLVLKNSPETWVKKTIEHYTDKKSINKVKNKLIIGLPFHGFVIDRSGDNEDNDNSNKKGLKGNILDSEKTLQLLLSDKTMKANWDDKDKEHVLEVNSKEGHYMITYPTSDFIENRLEFVDKESFGGISIWELGQGEDSLLDVI